MRGSVPRRARDVKGRPLSDRAVVEEVVWDVEGRRRGTSAAYGSAPLVLRRAGATNPGRAAASPYRGRSRMSCEVSCRIRERDATTADRRETMCSVSDLSARPVDQRDARWEEWSPRYRVYFWRPFGTGFASREFENRAEQETFTLFAVVDRGDGPGLVRLAGADPTRSA
jgi:hypothetical protein